MCVRFDSHLALLIHDAHPVADFEYIGFAGLHHISALFRSVQPYPNLQAGPGGDASLVSECAA